MTTLLIRSLAFSLALVAACGDDGGGDGSERSHGDSGGPCQYCGPAIIWCEEGSYVVAGYIADCDEVGDTGACYAGESLVQCEATPCDGVRVMVDGPGDHYMSCAGL
jgi:hypothetical protein